jgi:hypothetical protein
VRLAIEALIVQRGTTQGSLASVAVTRSGFSYSPLAKRYAQTLALTNTAGSTITGPIYVILDNLTSSAALYNTGGSTACAAPASASLGKNLRSIDSPGCRFC